MKALVKTSTGLELQSLPAPKPQDSRSIIVKVSYAAICRTDLYVAAGKITSPDNLILGHEATGTVVEVGSEVTQCKLDDRIVLNPLRSCLVCSDCKNQRPDLCGKTQFMGQDFNGAFSEYICVPASEVTCLPPHISPLLGTYTEPLASTRAVLESSLSSEMNILILGEDRIAALTERVLAQAGFSKLTISKIPSPTKFYDAIVETCSNPQSIIQAVPHLKTGGLLVVKSRTPETLNLPILTLIKNRVRIEFVHFSPFERALTALQTDVEWVERLIGPQFSLSEYERAFQLAEKDTSKKIVFSFS